MSINVNIPASENPKTVRDAIVYILCNELSLTARKIYNRTRKHGFHVTYQAVHKVLKQMKDEDIILKQGKEYSINMDWVRKNKKFYDGLVNRDENTLPSVEDVLEKDIVEIKFDNLYKCYQFLLDALERIAEMSKGEDCAVELYHMYWALVGSKREQEQFKKILRLSPKAFFICRGDTFADRMLAKFYEGYGAKVKTGVSCANNCDMMAGGDYLIQMFLDAKLKKELDKHYENINDINSPEINNLYKQLFDKKVRISVLIKKDRELMREMQENIKKEFVD